MNDAATLRATLIQAARAMAAEGLSPGTSGNISARVAGGLLVTPTGMPADTLEPGDLVMLDLEGRVLAGRRLPSSEWPFHCAILQARPEVGAVVHCHSRHATALACLRRAIPAFHYMVAAAGGDHIACGDYATFGTQALSDAALAALGPRRACLLANHGQIAVGPDLASALKLAREVEVLAAQYLTALAVGEPVLLDAEEMARVLEKFRTYGQQAPADGAATAG
ncbi:class II aldolase/adducin family protein [Zavarzinia sp. CC-PAN008]|uniref:class II aldolase/adducin family protein n=1 Tax=Zavarzinia sp. CC-PAN008 TaxID=3243332 RepID=UPI003F749D59